MKYTSYCLFVDDEGAMGESPPDTTVVDIGSGVGCAVVVVTFVVSDLV